MSEPMVSDERTLAELGYSEKAIADLRELSRKPYGLILFVGAPNSGRSTGLFTALGEQMRTTCYPLSVSTVAKEGQKRLTGAECIPLTINSASEAEEQLDAFRKAMRRDSEIIALDLIRSPELAEEVFRAVKQGQKVWGSIAGRDITTGLDALLSFGIPEQHVYDPDLITGIASQRLVPTLCESCKIPLKDARHFTDEDHSRIDDLLKGASTDDVFTIKANGCPDCQRGLSQKTAIIETVVTDANFMSKARTALRSETRAHWRQNMSGQTMFEHAMEKVRTGLVDPLYLLDRVPDY